MPGESTTLRGKRGEDQAVEYLRGLGYRITERNFRCKLGELDIIARDARDGQVLVFVEVRTRASVRHGSALETVTASKQRQVARVASFYLDTRRPVFDRCRFDVIAITGDRLEHITDAFRIGL